MRERHTQVTKTSTCTRQHDKVTRVGFTILDSTVYSQALGGYQLHEKDGEKYLDTHCAENRSSCIAVVSFRNEGDVVYIGDLACDMRKFNDVGQC